MVEIFSQEPSDLLIIKDVIEHYSDYILIGVFFIMVISGVFTFRKYSKFSYDMISILVPFLYIADYFFLSLFSIPKLINGYGLD